MVAPNQPLELGQNLEDFTIVKVLGAGGFGITYQGIDRTLQRNVAIKEYFPQQFAERRNDHTIVARQGDENSDTFQWGLDRFLTEARTLAKIDHPNVVKVFGYFEANSSAYLIMAFEEGVDLEDWLRERSAPLSEAELTSLVLPMLDGLEAIHAEGLIHRDIKPRNIVIRGNGTPVLIDFGAARRVGQEQTSLTALISPGFSPPEQYSSDPSAQGPWTDVYAMAGVVYRMISGNGPLEALNRVSGTQLPPANEVSRMDLSPGILAAVEHGLALAAGERPQSVAAFRALLLAKKAETTSAASHQDSDETYIRPPVRESAGAPQPKRPWGTLLVLAAIAAIAATGYVYRVDLAQLVAKPKVAVESPPVITETNIAPQTTPPATIASADKPVTPEVSPAEEQPPVSNPTPDPPIQPAEPVEEDPPTEVATSTEQSKIEEMRIQIEQQRLVNEAAERLEQARLALIAEQEAIARRQEQARLALIAEQEAIAKRQELEEIEKEKRAELERQAKLVESRIAASRQDFEVRNALKLDSYGFNETDPTVDLTTIETDQLTVAMVANLDEWQSTGLTIKRGSSYSITAPGIWRMGPLCKPTDATGEGMYSLLCLNFGGQTVANYSHSALIGKIGKQSLAFYVGTSFSFTADRDGTLYLRSNDVTAYVKDNSGNLDVTITLR